MPDTKPTILVVENEFLVVAPAIELLRDEGFEVLEAASGNAALQSLAANPQVAVMAVDIGLPGMTGNDVVREARRRRGELKVIMMTGYDASAIEIPQDERTLYLMKPYLPADMLDAVRTLLG